MARVLLSVNTAWRARATKALSDSPSSCARRRAACPSLSSSEIVVRIRISYHRLIWYELSASRVYFAWGQYTSSVAWWPRADAMRPSQVTSGAIKVSASAR